MQKKHSKALEDLEKIRLHRLDLFQKLLSKKLTSEEFAHSCFQFILQHKIRPVAKAHDMESIILNYYYWLILIERKVAIERRLIELGVGSVEKAAELTEIYIRRRDQMVRRLIWEHNQEIKDAYVIFGDTIELVTPEGEFFYSSKESLDKIKFFVEKIGISKISYYLPIMNINYSPIF